MMRMGRLVLSSAWKGRTQPGAARKRSVTGSAAVLAIVLLGGVVGLAAFAPSAAAASDGICPDGHWAVTIYKNNGDTQIKCVLLKIPDKIPPF